MPATLPASVAANPVSHAGSALPNSAVAAGIHPGAVVQSAGAAPRTLGYFGQERRNRGEPVVSGAQAIADRREVAGDQAEHAENGLACPQRWVGVHEVPLSSSARAISSAPSASARSTCHGKTVTSASGTRPAASRSRRSARISSAACARPSADQSGNMVSCAWSPVNVADTGRCRRRCRRSGRGRSRLPPEPLFEWQRHPSTFPERALDGVDGFLHPRAVIEVAFVRPLVCKNLGDEAAHEVGVEERAPRFLGRTARGIELRRNLSPLELNVVLVGQPDPLADAVLLYQPADDRLRCRTGAPRCRDSCR